MEAAVNELLSAINTYIDASVTSYAILINGEWGCGKTYFIKNEVTKLIEKKEKKPLYISLYGISNLDDIQRELFYKINTILGKNTVQKIAKLGLAVAGSLNISQDKLTSKDWIFLDKSKHVLIFDDLERAQMPIEQILGFINSIVEHEHVKTILIANEKEIIDYEIRNNYVEKVKASIMALSSEGMLDSSTIVKKLEEIFLKEKVYSRIKEKVIYLTFDFIPDIQSIVTAIIEQYKGKYRTFLRKHIKRLMYFVEHSKSRNFRVLRNSLDTYASVFRHLDAKHKKHRDKYSLKLLLFTMATTFEIKQEHKSDDEIRIIENLFLTASNGAFSMDKELMDKSQAISAKYFPQGADEFIFSKTVFHFIKTGYFELSFFDDEINSKETPPKSAPETLSQALMSGEFYKYTNVQFDEQYNLLLNYIDAGKIQLYMYPSLFSHFYYLSENNAIKNSVATIKEKFIRGIERAYNDPNYEPPPKFLAPITSSASSEELREIQDLTNKYIQDKEDETLALDFQKCLAALPESYDKFENIIIREQPVSPVLHLVSGLDLFKGLLKLSNEELENVISMLNFRYEASNIGDFLYKEKLALNELSNELEKYLVKQEPSLSYSTLSRLQKQLDKYQSKLNIRSEKTLIKE